MTPAASPFRAREAPGSPSAGPSFLLIHGYGASSFTWRGLAPALATRGRVVQVDLVGHEDVDYPDRACAPATLAEHLLELVIRRDLAELTLVGHSLGGGVALRLAQRLLDTGDRLARLIVVAGAAYEQPLPPFVSLANRGRPIGAAFRVMSPALIAGQVLRTIVFDPGLITGEMIEGYARPLGDPSVRRALLAAARVIVPEDLDVMIARYPEIAVPSLLVWGRQDRVVPLWVGRRLADDLPRAELVVLERCGHLPMEEQPAVTLRTVTDFLDRTAVRAGT